MYDILRELRSSYIKACYVEVLSREIQDIIYEAVLSLQSPPIVLITSPLTKKVVFSSAFVC